MRSLLLLSVLLLSACGRSGHTSPATTGTDSTAHHPARTEPAPLADGYQVIRAANGQPSMEGEIRNGKRDGVWTSYTQQGGTKSRNRYVDGVLEGPTVVWYDDGRIRYTGQHHKDKPVGEWKFYDEQGKLASISEFDSTGVEVKR